MEYLTAEQEDYHTIAQANAPLTENSRFVNERVKCRFKGEFPISTPENIQYMDVAPAQIVSAAAALIPFLEHDDANRASNGFEHAASSSTITASRSSYSWNRIGEEKLLMIRVPFLLLKIMELLIM